MPRQPADAGSADGGYWIWVRGGGLHLGREDMPVPGHDDVAGHGRLLSGIAAGPAQLPSATGKIASATRPCASRCTEIAASASGASTRQKILPCSSSTQYCR